MYKGNMYEFVEKINEYINKNYERRVKLYIHYPYIFTGDKFKRDKSNRCYILYTENGRNSGIYYGYKVYDSKDFEEQVFKAVNNVIFNNKSDGFELHDSKKVSKGL